MRTGTALTPTLSRGREREPDSFLTCEREPDGSTHAARGELDYSLSPAHGGEGWGFGGAFEAHAPSPPNGIGLQADARTASEGELA